MFYALFYAGTGLFAFPGFTPYIPDRSGEYVYYRDYTFARESYTGFLVYDEKTFAARYYAPADRVKKLPEKSVEIYFTLDPSLDHIELTGERIATAITPEDTEIVNYLHDMVYEFTSRRAKAGTVDPSTTELFGNKAYMDSGRAVLQNFPQFSGKVELLFDYLIPLFNLKKITADDNSVVFQIVTTGVLRSSDDTSFSTFDGLPQTFTDQHREWKQDKNSKKAVYMTSDNQTITIDSSWKQSMDNLWLLGDTAILSAASVKESQGDRLLRMMLQSTENSYISWGNLSIRKEENKYLVDSIFFQPESKNVTRNFKVVTERKNGVYCILLLTVFNTIYQTNHQYFDTILKNYKAGE